MDTINLPATPSIPLNCRNTASNTSPIACSCCGSKDYMQSIPHANYFRTLCHGISRCKHSQDNYEDKCMIPPFFSSVSLLQPFSQNFSMPPSTCCTHNHLEGTATGLNRISGHKRAENENKVSHQGDYYEFDQKGKPDFKADKTSFYENPQKSFASLGTEYQCLAQPLSIPNLNDIQFNPYMQRCACEDSIPWTYSPFIVPIVSYYLLWNSQKCNNILFPNYPRHEPHIIRTQHDKARPNQKHSSGNESERKTENFDIKANNSSDDENYALGNILENNRVTNRERMNGNKSDVNSSPPMTTYSLNFIEDNRSNNTNKSLDCNSHDPHMEEAMEVDGFVVNDQTESDECLKVDKNTLSKVKLLISPDSNDDYLSSNEDITQSLPLKVHEEFESSEEHLSVSETGENLPSLKRSYRKLQDSDEECVKNSSELKATTFKEGMSFKKFIKNFNTTDQITNEFPQVTHFGATAGDDLDGDNCVGYKVHISPSQNDEHEKKQETRAEVNLEAKKTVLLKGLFEVKDKQTNNFTEKNKEAKISRFKSGIAKPSSSTQIKEIREPNAKKNNSVLNQRESYVIKRPGKPQKAMNTKTQFPKKEITTPRALSQITEKHSNTTIRIMKK